MNHIASEPFRFHTRQNLTYLLGRKARNIAELLAGIKEFPVSSVYHHTHHYLDRHEFLSPEPPNDYAYWIRNILQDNVLAEEIAGIDLLSFSSLRDMQERLIELLEERLARDPEASHRAVAAGEEFHFMAAQTFIFPTEYVARDLQEFLGYLRLVTHHSLYFHMFEARLFHPTFQFSYWFEHSMNNNFLGASIKQLDPYSMTMDNLRR